ncbi:MAG TPA: anhydro-N-acetylmuramic acid kinase [Actinophytocola sp.]|uniref:anhydro-N-acetylmuramic acid kinase n=1 Tax=Actinophytocola sp. TaxID=1872138 RepID=UPI002DDCE5DF|nr:anhydro-N-acetylmuramic acid kinase [Actinophytocola sp.]HEV2781675.1 anhydro-N-acetylmuramic acid kinase [Actinophytocola sp.]
MDGIDVAAADLRIGPAGTVELLPLGHREVPYPNGLRDALLAALPPAECTAGQLCRLDTEVGQAFAAAAAGALTELADGRADLVASLGQTIFHWVEDGRCLGTLQLGQPAWIAERTGLPVVADLRARDVAAGGHGAPLAAVLDALWLREICLQDRAMDSAADEPVAALNIGGIANVTVVGPDRTTLAFDTGPGNALLDAAARMISDGVWQRDVNGELAAQGSVRTDLLDALLADAYYGKPPPKSTGKEHFHAGYLRAVLDGVPHVASVDLLATLVELTAVTVADACRAHGVGRVVASGGGVRNPVLMAALRRTLAPACLVTSDELGLPTDAKEAYLAALLGFLTWVGAPGNAPSATGAAGPRLLGSVTPGGGPLCLPDPVTTAVTRLRVHAPEPVGGGTHGSA